MGYICIHGHFYQPPRENPWLEAIELQESAQPYHDWNERITAECYARNAASRINDDQERIVRIVNNYSKISFNFGPTLISWIETSHPDVYRAIQQADQESQKRYAGHGSALAQPYNHMIMPLANARDKSTQVLWGLRDFERRFGRKPEGMWLPETAVDLATLEVLAEAGIKFTILAPNQARQIRKIGGRNWKDVSNSRIDPTMVYRLRLPSGRKVETFFYDGPISRGIAFEGLLNNGQQFAERLLGAFSEDTRPWPELVHIATDGETYGHHHRGGEMALSYALEFIESQQQAELINYGLYLERHPPTHEVEIFENSSWSCVHGIERWRANCGCNSGGHAGWNQEWRAPLREAFDWLRDELAPRCESKSQQLLKDFWAARDDYFGVVLDRSDACVDRFLAQHAARMLSEEETVTALKLMELQRHAMLMFTSCGWFFDEVSGLETVQVIQYAGRAIQLAGEVLGDDTEGQFLERLSKAKSNIPEHQDGKVVYEKFVRPAFVSLKKLAGHYAIRSLFEPYDGETRIYSYKVQREAALSLAQGDQVWPKLDAGRARFTSVVTREADLLSFAAFQTDSVSTVGAAGRLDGERSYETLIRNLEQAFARNDPAEISRLIQDRFEGETYTLSVLFRDEQHRILRQIMDTQWTEADVAVHRIYPQVISVLRTLAHAGVSVPIPRAFQAMAEFALITQLRRAFSEDDLNLDLVRGLVDDASAARINLSAPSLEYALRMNLEHWAERLKERPEDQQVIERLEKMAQLIRSLPFEVNTWTVQNICYQILQNLYPRRREQAGAGDEAAKGWVCHFRQLAESLRLYVA